MKKFSVRLLNNVTICKKQKQQQKWEVMHKNQKILYENSYYEKQENVVLKQSATKLVCILYGGKVDLFLLRISRMLTKIL